jgi:hypothetical protein
VTAEKNVWRVFGECGEPLVNALAELGAFGVAFISLRDNLDLSTPSGRLMFQIIGAMAEFERALIQERVRAGLRNARAKGKRLGRPCAIIDLSRVAALRASGASWRYFVPARGHVVQAAYLDPQVGLWKVIFRSRVMGNSEENHRRRPIFDH